MLKYITDGWNTTKNKPMIITLLFIYQITWGYFLYQFIQSIVVPLLHRYPGDALTMSAAQIFLAESQFQLFKTDISYYFFVVLLALISVRLLLTPLFNAGIYYSIQHFEGAQVRPFWTGIKTVGRSFCVIYCIQLFFALLPLYWIIPYIIKTLHTQPTLESIVLSALPVVIVYISYSALLRTIFMYIQFGRVGNTSFIYSLALIFRYILPILSLNFILFLISIFFIALSFFFSIFWAGFIAILLHQLYHLFKTLLKVWEISAHYQLWKSKQGI